MEVSSMPHLPCIQQDVENLSGGIYVGAKYEIYCIINDMVSQGKAVIMISSELPELLGMSDRIYVMNEGRIVSKLETKETTHEKIMSMSSQITKLVSHKVRKCFISELIWELRQ